MRQCEIRGRAGHPVLVYKLWINTSKEKWLRRLELGHVPGVPTPNLKGLVPI